MESFPAGYWDLFTGFAGVLAGSERIEELVEGIRTITLRLEKTMEEKEAVQNSIQNISAVSEEVAASTQEVTATLGEQAHVVQNLKEEVEKLEEDAKKLNASIEKFKI